MKWKLYYRKSGIYKITINNKIYIGSSVDLYSRYSTHYSRLRRDIHENIHLQRAYNKYDKMFSFEVLETFEEISKKDLLIKEKEYMDLLNPYYNLMTTPHTNELTEDVKQKISTGIKKAYAEGRLINPWSLNGNYIDVYNYEGILLHSNILVKDAVEILNISNRSVINNAIRCKKYTLKNYIVVPVNSNMIELLKENVGLKYRHKLTFMPS